MRQFLRPAAFLLFLPFVFMGTPDVRSSHAMEVEDYLGTITEQYSRGVEMVLEQLSTSIRSLADAYVRAYGAAQPMAQGEKELWIKGALQEGKTITFRAFSTGPEPGFKAPEAAYLFYNNPHITPNVTQELKAFAAVAPLFKLVYRNLPYSWVYMTTVDEAFLIYPYLPLDEAVHNLPPTQQDFYKAADFGEKKVGWTRPYQDLAGDGMMVTVSYPVYGRGKLLGVVSRDITLTQLSKRLLKPAGGKTGQLIVIITDKNGLAIAVNRPAATQEIDRVNTRAKNAVLYFRTPVGLRTVSNPKAVASSNDLLNAAVENALASLKKDPGTAIGHFTITSGSTDHNGAVVTIPSTGWPLIAIEAGP